MQSPCPLRRFLGARPSLRPRHRVFANSVIWPQILRTSGCESLQGSEIAADLSSVWWTAFVLRVDRSRELGIRSALGASPAALIRLLLRPTLISIAIGIGGGVFLTVFAVQALRAFLFQTDAFDFRLWMVAVGLMPAVAALAAWTPAQRAAVRNPVTTSRQD